jgi:hypothetical protein
MENSKPESRTRFFHSIFDYAGMFPPASLSLSEAFRNYQKYLGCEYDWMLSKFICPFRKASEIITLPEFSTLDPARKAKLSMLCTPSPLTNNFIAEFAKDVVELSNLGKEFESKLAFETIELKLPNDLAVNGDRKDISIFLDRLTEIVKESFSHRVFIFCELPLIGDFNLLMRSAVQAIEIHNEKFEDTGFKLRTGGTDASDFPAPENIVAALRTCLIHKVTLKFTAGMHHPIRHFDKSIGTMMHGFINVFGAGIIAFRHAISDHELKKIISEEDPSKFVFTEEGFEWGEWKCSLAEIHGARNSLVQSVGSCSFDEPVDDLKKLGLI